MTILNQTIQTFAEEALHAVFNEQLGMWVSLAGQGECFKSTLDSETVGDSRIVGSVGLAGELQAVVCLNISKAFADGMAAQMFGLPQEEVSDAEVNDSVGEVTNMITG